MKGKLFVPKPYRDREGLKEMRDRAVEAVIGSDSEDPHSLYSDIEVARLAETACQRMSRLTPEKRADKNKAGAQDADAD